MGLRATVIRKYEIEYGDAQGFNYRAETLANIIGDFCDDFYCGDDGCGGLTTDVFWEIDKGQFVEMIDAIADMTEEDFDVRMKEDWFVDDGDKPYSRKYVFDLFVKWLAETPLDSNYVRLGWL